MVNENDGTAQKTSGWSSFSWWNGHLSMFLYLNRVSAILEETQMSWWVQWGCSHCRFDGMIDGLFFLNGNHFGGRSKILSNRTLELLFYQGNCLIQKKQQWHVGNFRMLEKATVRWSAPMRANLFGNQPWEYWSCFNSGAMDWAQIWNCSLWTLALDKTISASCDAFHLNWAESWDLQDEPVNASILEDRGAMVVQWPNISIHQGRPLFFVRQERGARHNRLQWRQQYMCQRPRGTAGPSSSETLK